MRATGSALVPSRYVVVSNGPYRDPAGRLRQAVYHTARARVLLVDPVTAEVLRGRRSPAVLDPGARRRLVELRLLVPSGTDEPAALLAASAAAARSGRQRRFVIMPTAYCNMGCGYCGQQHQRGRAPVAAAGHRAALVARVGGAIRSGRYDSVQVRWFGGEPLLAYAVLRALSGEFTAAADAHGTGYSALLVTNGVLLDQRKLRELHLRCRVDRIEVTIDGPAGRHEASRPLRNGGRSFERIAAALRTALADPDLAGLRLSVRTNVGRHHAAQAGPFARAMAGAGLAHPRVRFYPAPVHDWGAAAGDDPIPPAELAAVELAWYAAYLQAGLTCELLPTAPRPVVCAAVDRHSEVVAPDGRIYSCTEQPLVPGETERHVASVTGLPAGELRPAGQYDDWYDTVAAGHTGCRDCRLLPLCGGACPKQWREGTPPCPPLKLTVADRLDLHARSLGLVPAGPLPVATGASPVGHAT